jgi:phosphatidate cytidylyltransferase
MGAIADMAPPADPSALRSRLLSAAVLLPLAVAAAWLGSPYWEILVGVFAVVMAWEWAGMCAKRQSPAGTMILGLSPAGALSMLAVAITVAVAASRRTELAVVLLLLGAALSAAAGMRVAEGRGVWYGLGTLYIGLPSIAIIWLRARPELGLATLVWILALTITVDSGAYLAGRTIGGPKLAPRISPKKTWAGLAGGIVAAVLVGLATAGAMGAVSLLPLALASALLAIVEQAGDLAESGFKRYFGVKDSSRLIPGHGGFLDRVDGLLAVSLAVAVAQSFGGGLLVWTR